MKATYTKIPGKNWGLVFEEISVEMRDKIVGFVTYNSRFMDAPYKSLNGTAAPFIQSDSFSDQFAREDEPGFLFIEFWSDAAKHYPYIEAMKSECKFDVDLPELD